MATVAADVWIRPDAFGERHALHAVDARFVLQVAVRLRPRDLADHFLVAERLFARAAADRDLGAVEHLRLPAPVRAVARVHPVEVGGEERGLVAAGPRADLEDDVATLVGVGREERFLELLLDRRDQRLEPCDLERGLTPEIGIVAQHLGLVELGLELLQALPELDDRRDVRALLHRVAQARLILEHGGIHQLRVELLDPRLDVLELLEHGAMLSLSEGGKAERPVGPLRPLRRPGCRTSS